ncbi:FAD-binding oxidoreductase [Rhizobium lemnae]|uniref:NAD(P)/FAD-dependent oxidoreductase n=1 Tax=Rhizobium lemnae TaxID=1214924 RepID=A0ABV8ECY7_9HYPH|nr:FAD-dependent oxidoreductase [Rhizobium lemnae]MCJ8507436.1 FAD-binding oxidoreductase [Rhizobium lemnae]
MNFDYDVLLIGGGITGLMAAQKLSDLGLKVALVEKHTTFASGPSTRNEGWLHRGTYHASSIRDRKAAIQVARRCIYGHKQLRRFSPEAVEDPDVLPLALIRREDTLSEVISRWDEADVKYRPISRAEAERIVPDATFENVSGIFQVADVSLNTRILYRKLLALAQKSGCSFYLGSEIEVIDGQAVVMRDQAGVRMTLKASTVVYSSGIGAKEIFRKHHGIDLPIRYWKSHLVVTKRLAHAGIFFLDPHEAAMMHHGDVSIIGFNEDALMCAEPSYDVLKDRAENLHRGICRIFPSWDSRGSLDVACVKVDYVTDLAGARSLNIAISEPVPGHVVVLPGKMTEAPYLTDVLTSYIHDKLDNPAIARRPCDEFPTLEAEATREVA